MESSDVSSGQRIEEVSAPAVAASSASLAETRMTLGAWIKTALVYSLFHALSCTWRLSEEPLPETIAQRLERGEPVVFAHFHEDEWAMLSFYAHRRMNVMVSLSADGGVMTRFLNWLGYRVVRGSSSRGGATALLGLIRCVRSTDFKGVSLAVDGPRGPRRRAKKGVFKLAEALKAPIVSGAAVASQALVFRKSWSKAFLPLPFSRVRLSYATIMNEDEITRGVERDDYATLAFSLEERMKAAKDLAFQSLEGGS